jgi:photosystem II stability/assembly factor-like uncharacterized protein
MTSPTAAALMSAAPHTLLIGTKKGAWVLASDDRRVWRRSAPLFFGQEVYHLVADPRDALTLLAATATGHLGPTVFRSTDGGETWQEATKPPSFPAMSEEEAAKLPPRSGGRSLKKVFWMAPGHASRPGEWLAGTSPFGLFRTRDAGDTWEEVDGFNNHPLFTGEESREFFGWVPDGPLTHSIRIDPRDANHLYVAMSSGGVLESCDDGATWAPLNAGCEADFLPHKDPPYGQDPHLMRIAPSDPDRLWQQNHCGIYRMDRGEGRWHRVGRNMPAEVGDIGFGILVHPRDPDRAWVFPMDGTEVWPRTCPGGRPALYETRDAGATWTARSAGMPEEAWWTVFRQALAIDASDPVGLAFGTTSGEVWTSADEGANWSCAASHLPRIMSVVVGGGEP